MTERIENTPVTARDIALLTDLYTYRYLSVSQIEALHFPSRQTAYRRLRALADGKFLEGFTAPHIPEHLYYLTDRGAAEVAAHLGVAVSDLSWHKHSRAPKDYYFLRHFLRVSDFRIRLTQACAASDWRLLGFLPEYLGKRTEGGSLAKHIRDVVTGSADPAEKLSHTPDAVFALGKGPGAALFFLEIDRGTEVISDETKGVLKCLRFYLQYLVEGGFQRYQQDFGATSFKGFRMLFVTTSESRVTHIREAAREISLSNEKAKRFIWLSSWNQIESSGVLETSWVSADLADPMHYRIG